MNTDSHVVRVGICLASLMLMLTFARPASSEEIFPRIYVGGVSGVESLAVPENSDDYRADGGGMFIHASGWMRLDAEQQVAAQANFSFNDVAVEIGFTEIFRDWYLDNIQSKGMRPKFVTVNAFSVARVPTVGQWTSMLAYYRAGGIDEQTMILPTFEYANFPTHKPTLSANKISQRIDFQEIIAASGGLTLDVPPHHYFAREQAYRDWIIDAIHWAKSNNYLVAAIVSPDQSGLGYPEHVRSFVDSVKFNGAVPNIFVVENYSNISSSEYINIVGNEDTSYHQLGTARLLQTQYLPAVMGRSADFDGDGVSTTLEVARGRSDYDPSDFSFDFGVAGDMEGWVGARVAGLTVSDGSLKGTATTVDPHLARSGIYIDGGRTQNLLIKMKASSAGAVQVYWATDGGAIMPSNVMHASYGPANAWITLLVPVANHANWRNHAISTIRVDPISVAGAEFEIDWIVGSDGDFDRDGIADSVEGFVDTNNDGIPNAFDIDSDGDGVTDDRERVISRNRLDPSDMLFGGLTTSLVGSSEGWVPTRINDFIPGGGWLLRGTSGSDAQIRRRDFHFTGADATKIQIYLLASSGTPVQFYWGVQGDDTFKSTRFKTEYYTTPGAWQLITFDMSSNPMWTAEVIKSIRIDPAGGAGNYFEIRSINALP